MIEGQRKAKVKFEKSGRALYVNFETIPPMSTLKCYSTRQFKPCELYEHGFKCNIKDFYEICKLNNIDFTSLEYETPETFYWYEFETSSVSKQSCKLTKKFLYDFWNYDAKRIIRHETNDGSKINMLGFSFPEFQSVIVDWDDEFIISDDVTDEEIKAILRYYPEEGGLKEQAAEWLEAKKATTHNVAEARKTVDSAERVIDHFLDLNLTEIKRTIKDHESGPNVLDCGWVEFFSENKELCKALRLLNNKGIREDRKLNVKFPYITQSTTGEKAGAEILCKYVNEETDLQLGCYSVLD